jgi:hypothetical protein
MKVAHVKPSSSSVGYMLSMKFNGNDGMRRKLFFNKESFKQSNNEKTREDKKMGLFTKYSKHVPRVESGLNEWVFNTKPLIDSYY